MAIYRPKTLTVPSGSDSYKLRGLTDAEVTKLANAVTDISGKLDTSLKGAANGLAELDSSGKVPSSQLPSYVDDVEEYAGIANFPATGESSKIYIDTATNKTYRWSGTTYVPTSTDLALGETSSTAYRGDRGKTAYDHATDANKIAAAQNAGLYKVGITAEGHVASAEAVQKSDITALGIPGSDTTYSNFSGATSSAAGSAGLVPAPAQNTMSRFLCADGTWKEQEGGKLIVRELDTVTNTSGSYTHTTTISDVTHDMKAVMIEVSNPDAFGGEISVTTADGSITLDCDNVKGTSDVVVSLMFIANADPITSSEFDVLSNRIGTLGSLTTTEKSSLVGAVNELNNGKINKSDIVNNLTTNDSEKPLSAAQGKALSEQIATQSYSLITSKIALRKTGNVVFVSCFDGSYDTDSNLAVYLHGVSTQIRLPEGYRPVNDVSIVDPASGKRVMFSNAGYMFCYPALNNEALRFSCCFVVIG